MANPVESPAHPSLVLTSSKSSKMYYSYDEPGTVPGTLRIKQGAAAPKIVLFDYNEANVVETDIDSPEDIISYLDSESISWVDVRGLGNEDMLNRLGEIFQLHPLLLEDIVNVPQRPKIEDYQDQVIIITQMVTPRQQAEGFVTEQVSLILGPNYLLTVQEEPLYDCFDPVRSRILLNKGVIRRRGPDYLAYALMDMMIDSFFPVLETYGVRLEELEDEVVLNPSRKVLKKIYKIRRELMGLRHLIWSQREVISTLLQSDFSDDEPDPTSDKQPLFHSTTHMYLRDCYDHAIQLLDITETYRESASSLMEVYLSSVNNRMNDVMKTLTVISTIFIPLTFIVGVYGMNFNPEASPFNMPELNWFLGYPLVWLVMLIIASSLIIFCWQKGWFKQFS